MLTLAAALIATAASGAGAKHEPACRPSWFVPSLDYGVHTESIGIDASFTYLGRSGAVCHIPASRSYYGELLVLGRGGYDLVPPDAFGFSGDEPAGGGGGGGVDVPLRAWCRRQPVELKLLGPGPGYPPSGRSYKLVLRNIRIHC